MHIKSVRLIGFKRFHDLEIQQLPSTAKLVVLAGPNGSGKSSLFDAFQTWKSVRSGRGVNWDPSYHPRSERHANWNEAVQVDFWEPLGQPATREMNKVFYFRSAYRNDPDFAFSELSRVGNSVDENRFTRMVDSDQVVGLNYRRLVSQAFADVFTGEAGSTTIEQFRHKLLSKIQSSLDRLFPGLVLNSLGDPLENGTFRFDKGNAKGFLYKNLSGGEKAAFDLILDLVVKTRDFDNTVFCIDEPESHMNTRLQAGLLTELQGLVPSNSQLWIASHSIGMMRRARELWASAPNEVVFLDFGNQDFDHPVSLMPQKPNREFWERMLYVALDDLATLVTPKQVIICGMLQLLLSPGGVNRQTT